jgi:hypothetical protein
MDDKYTKAKKIFDEYLEKNKEKIKRVAAKNKATISGDEELDDLLSELSALIEIYALEDDSKLTKGAQKMKYTMIDFINSAYKKINKEV